MESIFTIILLCFVVFFYIANPGNKINRSFAVAAFFCWLGAAKEAMLYNLVPFLESAYGLQNLSERFLTAYSLLTWALYSFALPAMLIFAFYFCGMDAAGPRRMRLIGSAILIPAAVMSFIFPPLDFRSYQMDSSAFAIAYSAYNLCYGVIYVCLMIKGVRIEKPGKVKTQKKQMLWCALSPVIFWLLSATLPPVFKISSLYKLWQANVVILAICLVYIIVLTFQDGFMGLRLIKENYDWSSDMRMINKGAEYTGHMLKNQTAKMEWCIENLKTQYAGFGSEAPPEELAILSRSIAALKSYTEKIRHYSSDIYLNETPENLVAMLEEAAAPSALPVRISIPDELCWICDKTHMTEVFHNILSNAGEAASGPAPIEIYGQYDKKEHFYLLTITDHGQGMDGENLERIFTPYFTTKPADRSFGLGLAYSKNVVEKHGGHIKAASARGQGTTITIAFPAKKVSL